MTTEKVEGVAPSVVTVTTKLTPEEQEQLDTLNKKILYEMVESVDLLEKLKKRIEEVSNQIEKSFTDTRIMYWSIFILGIGLVLAAVPVAVLTKTELFSVLFGSVGVIEILAFFLKDPPQQLQKSRAYLSKLQAAYYQWLIDASNWSILLYNLSKSEDPITKEPKLGIDDMKKASDSYIASFSELMRAIDGGAQDKGAAAK